VAFADSDFPSVSCGADSPQLRWERFGHDGHCRTLRKEVRLCKKGEMVLDRAPFRTFTLVYPRAAQMLETFEQFELGGAAHPRTCSVAGNASSVWAAQPCWRLLQPRSKNSYRLRPASSSSDLLGLQNGCEWCGFSPVRIPALVIPAGSLIASFRARTGPNFTVVWRVAYGAYTAEDGNCLGLALPSK